MKPNLCLFPGVKSLVILTLGLLILPSPGLAGSSIDLLAVAEQTDAGAKLVPATPERPAYYVAFDAGYLEAGDPIAGLKPPVAAEVGQALRNALDTAGYQEATAQDAPSLVLVYHYGSLRPGRDAVSPRVSMRIGANLRARLSLVAPKEWAERAQDYILYSGISANHHVLPHVRDTMDFAQDARYFIMVSAYDYGDFTRQTPTLLWSAKLSALDTSGDMDEVVPALAGASGPFLGRNFRERQFGTALPIAGRKPGGSLSAPASFFPPREAMEKIDAGFLRDLLLHERLANFGHDAVTGTDPPAAAVSTSSSVDAFVIAERTEPGANAPRPAPEHPVYYIALDGGYLDSNDPGTDLKLPISTTIGRSLRTGLDTAGYAVATSEHAPALVLVYYYGLLDVPEPTTNPILPASSPAQMASSSVFYQPSSRGIYSLVIPSTLARRYAEIHPDWWKEKFGYDPPAKLDAWAYAAQSRYFVLVSAYDYADFVRQKPTKLWWAKLSAPKTSGELDEILPALAGTSGPYLGHNFKSRQTCPIRPAFAREREGSAAASPFPREARDKIDAKFLRKHLQSERADIVDGAILPTVDEVTDSTVVPPSGLAGPPVDVLVVAEQTEPGAKLPVPAPENPTYYLALDGGYLDSGDPVTGLKPTTRGEVGRKLRVALDAAGYAEATAQHPPSQVLIYYYGLLEAPESRPQPGIALPTINNPGMMSSPSILSEPASPGIYSLVITSALAHRYEVYRAHGWTSSGGYDPPESQDAWSYAHHARYFVVVSAYDYADFIRQKPTMLWCVKLSAPKTGGGIDEIIPALAGAGGPYLGRDFQYRQSCSIRPMHREEREGPAPISSSPLLRAAEEKIDAKFLRSFLQWERTSIFRGHRVATVERSPASTRAKTSSLSPDRSGAPVEALAVAEQTEQGAMLPPPTPGHPAYYLALDGGYLDSGRPVMGLKPPTRGEIGRGLRAALDTAGYDEAGAQDTPSFVLIYYYGLLQDSPLPRTPENGAASTILPYGTSPAGALYGLVTPSALARLVGEYYSFGYGANAGILPHYVQASLDYMQHARYFLMVVAYDYSSLSRKSPVLLWLAKLSVLKTSGEIDEILPALADASGPYLGRSFNDRQFFALPPAPAGARDGRRPDPAFPLSAEALAKIDADFLLPRLQWERDAIFSGHTLPNYHSSPAPSRVTERSSLSPALARRVAAYQGEKEFLQNALTARLKAVVPGGETRRVIDAFNAENASRILQLEKAREDIRTQLAQSKAAGVGSTDKSLDTLLREFAAGLQQLEPEPVPETP